MLGMKECIWSKKNLEHLTQFVKLWVQLGENVEPHIAAKLSASG
jgi:hypothetical protein